MTIVLLVGLGVMSILTVVTFLCDLFWPVQIVCIAALAGLFVAFMRQNISPDQLRARQSNRTLRLAGQTLTHMRHGLNRESAQSVCKLLLPATDAVAVAITDTERVLGYAGIEKESHQIGSAIQTAATRQLLEDGEMRVLVTPEEVGFPGANLSLRAGIIAPLVLRDETIGSLKLYYRTPERIDRNQRAMAEGLAQLLSTQLSLAELEKQSQLASEMKLKALQAQINPHFLFNTINTIASLIRTDPAQARILLREFANFYRRTLESSEDSITIEQEMAQTLRYLGFEIARFGSERIKLSVTIEQGLEHLEVPAFIVQPLVENAVGHAMREEEPLHIDITVSRRNDDVIVVVQDDGVGMNQTQASLVMQVSTTSRDRPERSGKGTGIAVRNVRERLTSYFGGDSDMIIESQPGVGTIIYLVLGNAATDPSLAE
jgi:two-component system, LytTR family, sensor histidine kinase LytS